MTEEAKEARRKYYRERYKTDKAKHKIYVCHVWENKARKLYDKEYIPPVKEGVLSEQAAELRRQYYAEYRKKTGPTQARRDYMKRYRAKNKEKITQYNKDYWERKAATDINKILET